MKYTVAVGGQRHAHDGSPAPECTCGHAHRTIAAAQSCGEKLYSARRIKGVWSANAKWHGWYVLEISGLER